MAPLQIRSQALCGERAGPSGGPLDALMCEPDSPAAPEAGNWRDADLRRVIAAAREAGLESYRIEIAPDGTLSIVVGDPADTAPPDGLQAEIGQP